MTANLSIFCLRAHELIHSLKGDARLNAFFNYRYRVLADNYPHEPFGVGQSNLDFFLTTHQYLIGSLNIDDLKGEDYKGNYARWIKLNKLQK